MKDALTLAPIGVLRTPFADRVSAPRQTYVAPEAEGSIVLRAGHHFEHALEDVASWEYLWVLYWFHLNDGWRPKVLPPRSRVRRGVFSTRSPHRPNPIGLSVVRLVRVEGLTVYVRGVDMVDGSPVLDIKPYVAAADSVAEAGSGWLGAPDPVASFAVVWSEPAREQAEWLLREHGVDLVTPVERTLALGPEPHPYRRIRTDHDEGQGAPRSTLAVKEWRVGFEVGAGDDRRTVRVLEVRSGYRAAQLAVVRGGAGEDPPGIDIHRRFCARFRPVSRRPS